jgi:hypothetical protein
MKPVIGLVVAILGVVLGLYVGGWVMFVGGIVDAVNIFQGVLAVTGMSVAIAIVKIFGGATVGTTIAIVGVFIAKAIAD